MFVGRAVTVLCVLLNVPVLFARNVYFNSPSCIIAILEHIELNLLQLSLKNSTSLIANVKLLRYLYIKTFFVFKLKLTLTLLIPAATLSGGN